MPERIELYSDHLRHFYFILETDHRSGLRFTSRHKRVALCKQPLCGIFCADGAVVHALFQLIDQCADFRSAIATGRVCLILKPN